MSTVVLFSGGPVRLCSRIVGWPPDGGPLNAVTTPPGVEEAGSGPAILEVPAPTCAAAHPGAASACAVVVPASDAGWHTPMPVVSKTQSFGKSTRVLVAFGVFGLTGLFGSAYAVSTLTVNVDSGPAIFLSCWH